MDALSVSADPDRAASSAGFFKTGPGQYGEGDEFIGVTVPQQRKVARAYRDLPVGELDVLVDSPIHEHRLTCVIIAGDAFARGDEARRRELFDWYLRAARRGRINNWDIVDSSAAQIVGGWLMDRPRDLLDELADADDLWLRRIAMIATLAFIRAGDASSTLVLAPRYVDSGEDLLDKATGWMLREVGKRVDGAVLLEFLDQHAAQMPRTMLSYAVEHLEPDVRQQYRALR